MTVFCFSSKYSPLLSQTFFTRYVFYETLYLLSFPYEIDRTLSLSEQEKTSSSPLIIKEKDEEYMQKPVNSLLSSVSL